MLHSVESQLGTEFFGMAGNRNKILSAFTEAVKVIVYKKSVIGDLACPMAEI
jgi:hypothetical protein